MGVDKEREELYKSLWLLVEKLRGSVDGWDFKQYVLGMIFYRYISEDFENYINEYERSVDPNTEFDYSQELDEDWNHIETITQLVKTKGVFIPPSHLFRRMLSDSKYDHDNLNINLRAAFNGIEESSKIMGDDSKFVGLFQNIDLNSNHLGKDIVTRNRKILEIMNLVSDMKLGKIKDKETDIFGDAYEYLMGMYASNSGKKGGEYYTPPEVSELLARLATENNIDINRVYDPACGSGSLLLKFLKIAKEKNSRFRGDICGQEINFTTFNLCRMNLLLHGLEYDRFDIANEDTLINPKHSGYFEAIVSNPPYSAKWEGDDNNALISDRRFSDAGVLAPKKASDLAFFMHCLYHLHEHGVAAIISFPGALYRAGNETKIRKYLVDNNYIDCVIQLAENFFYGTSTSTCIVIMKKCKTENKTLFIDASSQFEKIKNKNRLNSENIDWILERYRERKDIDYISKVVDNSEIAKNKYNLSVNTYVEIEDDYEEIDIKAVNQELEKIVKEGNELRAEIDRIIKELEE